MQPNTHTHPRFLRKSAEKALQKSTPFGSKTVSFLVISALGPRVCQKRPQSCPWAPKVLKRKPNDGPKVPKDLKKEPKWSPKVHKGLKRVWKWSPKVAKSLTISSKRLCNDTHLGHKHTYNTKTHNLNKQTKKETNRQTN